MSNAPTDARILALLLFAMINANANSSDSIPIAEYCVVYEKKKFCSCCIYDDDNVDFCDSADVYLRLGKILQKQPEITICGNYGFSPGFDFYWTKKFLIHNDLKAERIGESIFGSGIGGGVGGASDGRKSYYHTTAIWHFAREVPIYAKSGILIDFNKYYEKGKIVPVEWEQKAECGSHYNVTFSGTYFIRITGECDPIPTVESYIDLTCETYKDCGAIHVESK